MDWNAFNSETIHHYISGLDSRERLAKIRAWVRKPANRARIEVNKPSRGTVAWDVTVRIVPRWDEPREVTARKRDEVRAILGITSGAQ